jgi:hypothetical protein
MVQTAENLPLPRSGTGSERLDDDFFFVPQLNALTSAIWHLADDAVAEGRVHVMGRDTETPRLPEWSARQLGGSRPRSLGSCRTGPWNFHGLWLAPSKCWVRIPFDDFLRLAIAQKIPPSNRRRQTSRCLSVAWQSVRWRGHADHRPASRENDETGFCASCGEIASHLLPVVFDDLVFGFDVALPVDDY